MNYIYQFASETGAETSLFGALGIDWRLLIIQIIAFLLLMVVLAKFVYPWLMKQVDQRQADIETAAKAATEAEKAAAHSREAVAELLDEARKEAADIVATAKLESAEMLQASETKSRDQAERIIKDAHEQLDRDVAEARKTLYNDTVELVAAATEKIVGTELTKKVDNDRIVAAIKESH